MTKDPSKDETRNWGQELESEGDPHPDPEGKHQPGFGLKPEPDPAGKANPGQQEKSVRDTRPDSDAKRTHERADEPRKARVPLGTHRLRMTVDPSLIPPDKVGRWVNDSPGRLQQAQAGGYEFVEDPQASVGEGQDRRDSLGTKISCLVGKQDNGRPLRAYLMMIDKDLWEQDQKDKQNHVDQIDESIRAGAIQEEGAEVDKTYVPEGGAGIEYRP